ncbi:Hypothetical protein A7982_00051 [Minicystis rosea]|nr:Hypothetical protein A7982_00051 [Minicystis rosea]
MSRSDAGAAGGLARCSGGERVQPRMGCGEERLAKLEEVVTSRHARGGNPLVTVRRVDRAWVVTRRRTPFSKCKMRGISSARRAWRGRCSASRHAQEDLYDSCRCAHRHRLWRRGRNRTQVE